MLKSKSMTAGAADRRGFGRRGTLWHAWIVIGGKQRLACHIRNVSLGGALLELAVPATVPPKFDLVVEDRGLSIRCEARHRSENGIGVSFIDAEIGRQLYDLSATQTPATTPAPTPAPIRNGVASVPQQARPPANVIVLASRAAG